jgi:hypothetical protein
VSGIQSLLKKKKKIWLPGQGRNLKEAKGKRKLEREKES